MTQWLELRLIRAFVVLAEERHFGRAAQRLRITQPALTRQIQTLETQVGAALLVRGPHGVALTEAGQELHDEGERLLAHGDRVLDRTQRAGRGDLGHVSVGFVGSALDIVVDIVTEFRERELSAGFTLTERPFRLQTAGLGTGEDDLAFVRDVTADDDCRLIELTREESCLVVPAAHPLAGYPRLTCRELRTLTCERFLSTRRWMMLRGVEPRCVDEIASATATLRLVETGAGISLMPAGYRSQAGPGVRFVPVAGHTTSLQLAIPRHKPSATVKQFLALVAQHFPQVTDGPAA